MNPLLFSLNNVLLASELGNVEMPDINYSCTWSLVDFRGGSRREIDRDSFERQEWNNGVESWEPCQMLPGVIVALEKGLKQEHEREYREDGENVREVARMRA